MPFLHKGEKWPLNLDGVPYQFAFQLTLPGTGAAKTLPGHGKTIRVFVQPDMEEPDLHVTIVHYGDEHQRSPKVPANHVTFEGKPFPAYRVTGWEKGTEIDSGKVIAWEDSEFDPDIHVDMLQSLGAPKQASEGGEHLIGPILNPVGGENVRSARRQGIKYGGYPVSWQAAEDYYIENGMRLQLDQDPAFDWMWGDGGMIHINPDTGRYDGDM